jgi:hypothetical protein
MAFSINEANVWHGDAFDSRIVSISVQSDGNPRIGCEIAARLAEHEIPVVFATVRPNGRKYEAVYGFNSQAEADRALELISEVRRSHIQVVGGMKPRKNSPPRRMRKSA